MSGSSNAEAFRALGFRALGYGFPLLTIPAFAGALPSAEYGRLGLALTFCALLQAISEGGHSIGGARQLIAAPDHHATIVGAIYDQKAVLLACCLLIGLAFHFASGSSMRDLTLFALCFVAIVVPDAATPLWEYQASGRLSDLTRIQFFSRAIALPIMLAGIWMWPNAPTAAALTGLPFLICALVTIRLTRSYLHIPGWRRPSLASIQNVELGQFLVYAGTMASTLAPTLAMQTMGFVYGTTDLGAIYLAVVLWLACRQLCALANQSAFRRFAIVGNEPSRRLMDILASARWGASVGVVAMVVVTLVAMAVGERELKYSDTLRALPWMLAGIVFYSMGHALAMNLFAATGRSGTFAVVHIASALTLSISCLALEPVFERPMVLGLACLAGDIALLSLSLVARRFMRVR